MVYSFPTASVANYHIFLSLKATQSYSLVLEVPSPKCWFLLEVPKGIVPYLLQLLEAKGFPWLLATFFQSLLPSSNHLDPLYPSYEDPNEDIIEPTKISQDNFAITRC